MTAVEGSDALSSTYLQHTSKEGLCEEKTRKPEHWWG